MTESKQAELFRDWIAKNHPFDWWAKDRDGEPLPTSDRTLVWELCRRAFEAGYDTRTHSPAQPKCVKCEKAEPMPDGNFLCRDCFNLTERAQPDERRLSEIRERWARTSFPEQVFTAHVKQDVAYLLSLLDSQQRAETFGDGHYCRHHPDDPAHGPDCYDHEKHFAAQQPSQWQDISTAPKDASWILGLMRTGRQAVVRRAGNVWEDDSRLCRDPVSWQPLPKGPQQ